MKKRALSLLLIMAMLATMLTGCDNKIKDEKSQVTENIVEYDYYQELNVLDDNYRNFYEIFVYSFYDSDGDCVGDLQGVIKKLDYVEYITNVIRYFPTTSMVMKSFILSWRKAKGPGT